MEVNTVGAGGRGGELLYLVGVDRDFESGALGRDGCVAHCELSGEGCEAR